jgi:hypothetical protein
LSGHPCQSGGSFAECSRPAYCAVSLKPTDMPEGMEAVIDMDWLTCGVVYTTLALPEASVTIGLRPRAASRSAKILKLATPMRLRKVFILGGVILEDSRPYPVSYAYKSLGTRPRTFPTIPDRVETPSLTITRRIKDFTVLGLMFM